MGKREIGQLSILDLIVSILIAELVAISIDNRNEGILITLIPIILLTFIQILFSYITLKSSKIRNLFDGNPSIIIKSGNINFKEMVKQRYNMDDLLTQLREKHIRSIDEVDYAVLETSGKLSVFKKDSKLYGQYPLPLILDGVVDKNALGDIKKDIKWVNKVLKQENVLLEEVFYAFFREDKMYIIRNSEK